MAKLSQVQERRHQDDNESNLSDINCPDVIRDFPPIPFLVAMQPIDQSTLHRLQQIAPIAHLEISRLSVLTSQISPYKLATLDLFAVGSLLLQERQQQRFYLGDFQPLRALLLQSNSNKYIIPKIEDHIADLIKSNELPFNDAFTISAFCQYPFVDAELIDRSYDGPLTLRHADVSHLISMIFPDASEKKASGDGGYLR
ncbi:MAG: hypothetical protein AB7T49_15470 [Oligoflexales bacterium]